MKRVGTLFFFFSLYLLATMALDFNIKEPVYIAITSPGNKLIQKLSHLNLAKFISIPCIKFSNGKDIDRFKIKVNEFDSIAITSPKSAEVFTKMYEDNLLNLKENAKIASIGKGTTKIFKNMGIKVDFEPSQPLAKALAEEIPISFGPRIAHPTSDLSNNIFEEIIESRGFEVFSRNIFLVIDIVLVFNFQLNFLFCIGI